MEFLTGLITGLVIGFLWGVWRATQSFIQRIIEQPEEIREIMERVERVSQDQPEVKANTSKEKNDVQAEFHQGVCYLYDHKGKFLAQGSTVNEAITAAEQRFPGMTFTFRVNESKESAQ